MLLTGNAGVESSNSCPLAGTLLASLVEDLADHGLTIVILELEDVGGDLNEEGVKNALVPLDENVGNLALGDTKAALEDVVGLSDKLHVTILNTLKPV